MTRGRLQSKAEIAENGGSAEEGENAVRRKKELFMSELLRRRRVEWILLVLPHHFYDGVCTEYVRCMYGECTVPVN